MGASGWDHVVAFAGSVQASYDALRAQVFASRAYVWNYGSDGWDEDESEAVRLGTLVELDEFKENEEFWEEGTHSILDTDRIVPAEQEDELGAIRPLSAAELRHYFGTERPTRDQFDREYQSGMGPLGNSNPMRWSGRCTTLFDGDVPAEVAFWGHSGD